MKLISSFPMQPVVVAMTSGLLFWAVIFPQISGSVATLLYYPFQSVLLTSVPVAGVSAYGVRLDQYNRVEFPPVTAIAVKLDVQLQTTSSAGILEWRTQP